MQKIYPRQKMQEIYPRQKMQEIYPQRGMQKNYRRQIKQRQRISVRLHWQNVPCGIPRRMKRFWKLQNIPRIYRKA